MSEQIGVLITSANLVRDLLDKEYCDPCSVLVVIPDRKVDRTPWVEIRLTASLDVDLEERIETTWPNVNFETVYTDEEGL